MKIFIDCKREGSNNSRKNVVNTKYENNDKHFIEKGNTTVLLEAHILFLTRYSKIANS